MSSTSLLSSPVHSNERLFLRDFVNCVAGSSGGRLAQWLQPGSRVDPAKCQVLYSREELHCGWPAIITVLTRDQYSDLVHVSNMKVEVKAIPIDKKELGECDVGRKMRRVSQPDPLTFGGLPPPPLHHPYEPTIRDKMCFHSITLMKPYQNYSFEELRYTSPPVKRSSENMLIRPNNDGTYSATWTPASIGCYSIVVNIDGYEMEEVFKVEVKEPPQGMTPPSQNIAKKSAHQPSKLRKFVAKHSAGLRIRSHPSLQSEQLGIVHVNGTIAFIDEIHNDDGVWLRLSADTIKQYCNTSVLEAWCLQYNQHLGKTLLLPVEEPKSILDQVITDTIMRQLPEISKSKISGSNVIYQVIKCGASGHNIRSRPSLNAPYVGMLALGNRVGVSEYTVNSDGCWILLDQATKEKYCFNTEGDAWSLAIGQNNVLYFGNASDVEGFPNLITELDNFRTPKKGFNFSCVSKSNEANFSFSTQSPPVAANSSEVVSQYPFIFGENSQPEYQKITKKDKKDNKVTNLPKWFKEDVKSFEGYLEGSGSGPVKFSSEQGANGNGITPPDTPKYGQSPKASPKPLSRNSSPVTISSRANAPHESPSSSPQIFGSSRSMGVSPLVSGTAHDPLVRRDSNQSNTSALVSSITRDISQSPSQATQPREMSPSPSGSSLHTRSELSPPHSPNSTKDCAESEPRTVGKDEKVSPKMIRKDRNTGKVRPKRAISPATLQQLPASSKMTYPGSEPIKQAISPSVAEALRIVHDAMACASFLKFHPTLPKQGALVVTRHQDLLLDKRRKELSKEEKARQRHSVEVSNAGNYLHIQPSTLESLTRSAANASANRNRRKVTDGIIKEEGEKQGTEGYGYQTISVLPPALKSIVYLWENLTSNCLQAISQQMVVESPAHKVKKGEKANVTCKTDIQDIGLSSYVHSSGAETLCELCGDSFPHPVTYHMHQAHPGCGQHAGGKGYNSGGSYCLGWAGNCGDGGVPGSSWYLLCESCRAKYVKTNRGGKQINLKNRCIIRKKHMLKSLSSPSACTALEPHIIMKNNAMFLLDLASSAETRISHTRRSSISPFGPLPPFQCLQTLGARLNNDEPPFYNEVLNKNFHAGFAPGQSACGQRPLSEVSVSDNDSDSNRGLRFHRSVSMGTNGIPWSKSGYDGRIIICEINEGGSSLLCNPSSALQKLTPNKDNPSSVVVENDLSFENNDLKLLQRPVLLFILQQHDLDSLQLSMKQALRKATCRVYAMQALNWLLLSVTQPICLHDLLWWFVTSLTPVEVETEQEEDNRPLKKEDDQDLNICEHPLSDITIAGEAVHPLPSTFHSLLQTIADLMVLLPMGSPLQQIAVRCWGLRFTTADHSFLHRSQVFSNISKILSRSEEMEAFTTSMHESHQSIQNQITPVIECLKDLTPNVEIKVSSRQAMIGSLTDNSTETFWESGDEDRNKTKSITVICPQGHHPSLICIHIDNCRDLGNKVSSIAFYSGQNTDELVKLRTIEVETRLLGGWVNCPITESCDNIIRLELKGPDNSVRVRQIRVLGNIEGESTQIGKQVNSATLQQKLCEAETLRVFRLITSQVFGKLLQGEEGQNINNGDGDSLSASESLNPVEESNDLREHMVGILFSRSYCSYSSGYSKRNRKSSRRMGVKFINRINFFKSKSRRKNSDTYCFEMLSMVLALSGSSVGRTYLSHQCGLLGDLLILLHTGSARVQRQVTSLLRRMLSIGILDVFLSIIPKALTVLKGAPKEINTFTLATSINLKENLHDRLGGYKGSVNKKLSGVIIHLIKGHGSGKFSDTWANITKGAIAENILNVTYLSEEQRIPNNCLKTPTLWLALASLCVLDKDHVERLSSGQWSQTDGQPALPRPTCNNHDDGETVAVIQCNGCGNLCADCDRYLHLHRKTRDHQRQVCKEEEEAIKVELHEGCGRTKLFWLLALADPRTLKALVEFREGRTRTRGVGISGICRFCGATGTQVCSPLAMFVLIMNEYGRTACTKLLSCGHMCGGVLGETKCLPCLHGCSNDSTLRQDSDDMCMICFTEALSCAPAIQLVCGHVFHLHCCKAVLMKRWAGPRITFSFSFCPICKEEIKHEMLEELLAPIKELYKDVRRKALMRLEYEGLHTAEVIVTPGARFHNDPASYAMDRYAYYVCYKCNKAYYGGEARCDAELGENYDPTELVCGACSDVARAQMCPKHGTDFFRIQMSLLLLHCRLFCFGTTHFCNPCHDDFQRVTNLAKNELPFCPAGPRAKQLEGDECPLHVKHPPTGEEFALGCGVCRNAHTF
ncbi:hypothetical protein NQ317_015370 [Molorchus minor]|uniref:E3 ubiquitin-protein ligase MYCBP2 n=1 Tax=Molorchus minor TaxID=1323400 RepID=A0ABQ9JCQ1_9CUCU|nr:hypothetical protein NQ317_015370 [Molorchus minor]